jgi:BASS family bile acid:Na+ symporter
VRRLEALSRLAGRYFALWVLLCSGIAYLFPDGFTWIAPYITLLLGVVMFGMGLTLEPVDFKMALSRPRPIAIGVAAQYVIMPTAAFVIAVLLRLPPELAAGLVLVGACPGGTASNVIVYLSRGDVPLSVTMTSISTLLAPVATPLITLLLAGQWLPVDPLAMFLSIVQVIIVPVTLGVLLRSFFPQAVQRSVRVVPLISVVAIVAIIAAIIGLNVDTIATAGAVLFTAVALHNLFGLLLGYLTALLLGLDEARRRAIAIEVGMQNSGLGAALATTYFTPLAALPAAIFSVWHNISGSLAATLWSRRPARKRVV